MARGDVLLISLPISDGREQSGKRPAGRRADRCRWRADVNDRANHLKSLRLALCLHRKNRTN